MPFKFKLKKKQLLAVGGVVLLLAAAAGFGMLTQLLVQPPTVGPKKQPDLPEVVDNVQNLRLEGKGDEAAKKIDVALEQKDTSNEVKYLLYMEKGNTNFDAKKYKEALEAYTQASLVTPTHSAFRLIGECNYLLGDKPSARAAYVRGIELVDVKTPLGEANKRDFQQRIDIIDGKDQ